MLPFYPWPYSVSTPTRLLCYYTGSGYTANSEKEEKMSEEDDLPTLRSLITNPLSNTSFKKSVKPLDKLTVPAAITNTSHSAKRSRRGQSSTALPGQYVYQDSADDEALVLASSKAKMAVASGKATSKISRSGTEKVKNTKKDKIIEFDTQDLVEELPKRRRIVAKAKEDSESSPSGEEEEEIESFGTDEDE